MPTRESASRERHVLGEHGANARTRGERRRQWDLADAEERLDHRKVRGAGQTGSQYKMVRLHITLTEEALAILDGRRHDWNFGRGEGRSRFIEDLIRAGEIRRGGRSGEKPRGDEHAEP